MMKHLSWTLAALWLLIVLAGLGCGLSKPIYRIYMVNRTPRELEKVYVYFNGREVAAGGHLVKGGIAGYGGVAMAIPDEAEVRWEDQGVPHRPMVSLRGIVPENPNKMNIYFIIEEDNSVTVKCVHQKDMEGSREATKGIEKFRK